MMCGEERDVSDSFSFPCRVVGCAPRALWGFPRKGEFSQNSVGSLCRELQLVAGSCCCPCPCVVCVHPFMWQERAPARCLQHCIREGTVGSLQGTDLSPQGTELGVLQECWHCFVAGTGLSLCTWEGKIPWEVPRMYVCD